eukprot:TRINITY_DN39_c0_g1_i3.p2 TRINITY_DN39_c0_g1~~TRINITY_DN39_c0_g1_i3.p2  ORF type:complete len:74 (+),score=45.18 TRINITY_DN39_c0_g1_i3:75-296(+)
MPPKKGGKTNPAAAEAARAASGKKEVPVKKAVAKPVKKAVEKAEKAAKAVTKGAAIKRTRKIHTSVQFHRPTL